jgi:hypothetical protein
MLSHLFKDYSKSMTAGLALPFFLGKKIIEVAFFICLLTIS